MKLILASASPRRRKLLSEAGIDVEVIPADVDETVLPEEPAEVHVKRLAKSKAHEVARQYPTRFVLGADTIVLFEGRIFGKPASLADAQAMLSELSDKRHQVITGVCIYRKKPSVERLWTASTEVEFRHLNQARIQAYCDKVHTLDKAGAYAAQEHGHLIIKKVEGLLSNVIGLPVEEVLEVLEELE